MARIAETYEFFLMKFKIAANFVRRTAGAIRNISMCPDTQMGLGVEGNSKACSKLAFAQLFLLCCRIGVVGIGWGAWMACYGAGSEAAKGIDYIGLVFDSFLKEELQQDKVETLVLATGQLNLPLRQVLSRCRRSFPVLCPMPSYMRV